MTPFVDAPTHASLAPSGSATLPRALAAGCVLAGVLMAPQAWSVWTRGTFLDPDDAMRAVQVRDLMGGQAWFDLVPHRLSPDHPFPMHWSRLVDAPLALGEWLFGRFMGADLAERTVRLIEPVALFMVTLVVMLRLARTLAGPRAMLPAACLFATSVELVSNFLPGHIHHHGVQVTLLVAATASLLASLGARARVPAAAGAGLLLVVSLGVSMQNLPFAIGLAMVAVVAWVVGHRPACLAGFGFGLLGAIPVFVLDVPPWLYDQGACDAFSSAHLAAGAAGAVLCLALAVLSPHLARLWHRAAAAGLGGAVVLVGVGLRFPACLGDPLAGVDPVLRDQWLSGVAEALPLWRLATLAPLDGLVLALTLGGGLAATAWATARARSADRVRWAALLLLAAIGVLGTFWQVRVAASACALTVPGLALAVVAVFDRVARRPARPALLAAVLFGMFANGAAWNALASPLKIRFAGRWTGAAAANALSACFEPTSLVPLAALTPGLVLSTIDPGSVILAYTPHAVLAAPYHRNTEGNRVSLLALAAPQAAARPMIEGARVRYLALCRFSNETAETAARHPESLSAALLAGGTPDWLTPVDNGSGAYLLFAVSDEAAGPR